MENYSDVTAMESGGSVTVIVKPIPHRWTVLSIAIAVALLLNAIATTGPPVAIHGTMLSKSHFCHSSVSCYRCHSAFRCHHCHGAAKC